MRGPSRVSPVPVPYAGAPHTAPPPGRSTRTHCIQGALSRVPAVVHTLRRHEAALQAGTRHQGGAHWSTNNTSSMEGKGQESSSSSSSRNGSRYVTECTFTEYRTTSKHDQPIGLSMIYNLRSVNENGIKINVMAMDVYKYSAVEYGTTENHDQPIRL